MMVADHVVAALLAIVIPFWLWRRWPRTRRLLMADAPGIRPRAYRSNILFLWALAVVTMAVWGWSGRAWADLGFGLHLSRGLWIALAIAAGIAGLMTLQYVVLLRSNEGRRQLRDSLGSVVLFLPRDEREMAYFAALSVTAGITEEIIYRGFLIWYVAQLAGPTSAGLAVAVVVSSIAFGLGHLYQGPAGVVRIIGVALVAGVLYVMSSSLWIVIPLHAYVDVAGGLVGMSLLRRKEPAGEPEA